VIAVDTSVIIDYIKNKETPQTKYLDELEIYGTPYSIPFLCCQEILQGAKTESDWKVLHQYISTQSTIKTKDPLLTGIEAARIYYTLRRKGKTVRSTVDCYIAQICIENQVQLLHKDSDFDYIADYFDLKVVNTP
jgi:predicted nucleic acid-binding protein